MALKSHSFKVPVLLQGSDAATILPWRLGSPWLKVLRQRHLTVGITKPCTVYPKKYAHGFVVLCFVVVMQSFIMNSHEVFIHIHQGCFAGTEAIIRLPQCQWSKPDGYGKISQCINRVHISWDILLTRFRCGFSSSVHAVPYRATTGTIEPAHTPRWAAGRMASGDWSCGPS